MEGWYIRISEQGIQRHRLLKMVLEGRISLSEAAVTMGVSYRQAKRLKKQVEEHGARGMVHGNVGRSPANKIDEDLRAKVLELSSEKYARFNDRHFTEMLTEAEGIILGRETVRLLRRESGQAPKRKRRSRKHHSRRPRKVAEGLMIQWDGSPHHWFGRAHSPCCLMSAVDDATSKTVGLRFVEVESSHAYLLLLSDVIRRHGIPASIYHDKHSALKRNDDNWSIEEQLAGRQEPTQVGRVLEELGIESIPAHTPQAKGRVEKHYETHQDRLVALLAHHGITDIERANKYLESHYINDYNSRFAVAAENAVSVWRKVRSCVDILKVISLKYESTVANDNAIRLGGMVIDVPSGPGGRGYAGARVEVRQLIDGSWRVYYKGKMIAESPATEVTEPIRTLTRRKGLKAASEARWVHRASAPPTDNGSSPAMSAAGTIRRRGPGRTVHASRIA
jgi:transposase